METQPMTTWPHELFRDAAVAALLGFALLLGCAVNPATGDRQLMLISESQEIAMGREAHEQILATMGVYSDDEAQTYVATVGKELAALSERPELPWTFTIIDDPVVNAFALPGGFIYVTRGIMTHLESEAELVAVLGHEIGHVTARHGASRMSKAQLAGLGLGVGMIVSPELRQFGDLVEQGLGLLFLKYSRDDERQADDLGLRYTLAGGWDARRMPEVFGVLKAVSELAGAGRLPNWLSTHPDPVERQERIREAIAGSSADFSSTKVNRPQFLGILDGMMFGENPREGFFEGPDFLHPELEFRVRFPADWKIQNQKTQVGGPSPDQDAAVVLTLAGQDDPVAAAEEFLSQEGLRAGRIQRGRVNSLPAAAADFSVPREQQADIRGRVAFVRYNSNTYRLLGFTLDDRWSKYGSQISEFLGSFDRLTDRRALAVQAARVEIVTPRRDLSLERFQREYPSTIPIELLALINHVAPDGTIVGGQGAKRVVGGPNR
jgi:predicted Zn-dependent protease